MFEKLANGINAIADAIGIAMARVSTKVEPNTAGMTNQASVIPMAAIGNVNSVHVVAVRVRNR